MIDFINVHSYVSSYGKDFNDFSRSRTEISYDWHQDAHKKVHSGEVLEREKGLLHTLSEQLTEMELDLSLTEDIKT